MNKKILILLIFSFITLVYSSIDVYGINMSKGGNFDYLVSIPTDVVIGHQSSVGTVGGMKILTNIYRTNQSNSTGGYSGNYSLNITAVRIDGQVLPNMSVNVYEAGTSNFVYGAITGPNSSITNDSMSVWVNLSGAYNYDVYVNSDDREIYNFDYNYKLQNVNVSADDIDGVTSVKVLVYLIEYKIPNEDYINNSNQSGGRGGSGMKIQTRIFRTGTSGSTGVYGGNNSLNITIIDLNGINVSNATVNVFEANTSDFIFGAKSGVNGKMFIDLRKSSNYDIHLGLGVNMYNVSMYNVSSNNVTLARYGSFTELDNMTVTVVNGSSKAVMPNQEVAIQIDGTSIVLCKGKTNLGGQIKCELNNSAYVSVVTDWWIAPMNLTGLNVTENTTVTLEIGYSLGTPCPDDSVCTSGFCSGDGFCCSTACEGGNCIDCSSGACVNDVTQCGYCDTCNGTTTAGFNCTGSVDVGDPLCDSLLNITLIDNDGNPVITDRVNVSINHTPLKGEGITTYNLSCSSNPFSDGMFICGVSSGSYYDIHVPSGANYTNVTGPNDFRLKDRATPETINFSKLTVTWYDSEGNLIAGQRVNVSETSPEGRKSVRDCTGDTNSQGKLYCGLAQNNTYDIMYNHSVFNTRHIIRGISFNSDVNQSISEGNATLNITLKDNNGDVVANQEINVTEQGTNNILCFGDTDANGVFVCALNSSLVYDVHVPSGGKYTNVTTSEFILEDRATPASIRFALLAINYMDRYGDFKLNEQIDVYETGTTYLACRGDTTYRGYINCGLDNDKTYDIMTFTATSNSTPKTDVRVPNNITILPTTGIRFVNPPTIVTLQGKLTDTSGTTVDIGSMYIEVINDGSGETEWSNTFNDVLDSGVFNIGLGSLSSMYLTVEEMYKVVINVDVDSATYSTADLTFGDGNPSNDLIKFVP